MAKLNNFNFSEWTGGASEQEVQEMIKKVRIRFWIYLALGLIPFLNLVFMGLAVFAYNNLSILKSRGRKNGNDLIRLCMILYGFFIFPIIEVNNFQKLIN